MDTGKEAKAKIRSIFDAFLQDAGIVSYGDCFDADTVDWSTLLAGGEVHDAVRNFETVTGRGLPGYIVTSAGDTIEPLDAWCELGRIAREAIDLLPDPGEHDPVHRTLYELWRDTKKNIKILLAWLASPDCLAPPQRSKAVRDPGKCTVGKIWTVKSGALRLSTKTDHQYDGQVEFAPTEPDKPTYQMRFIQLLCFRYPDSVSLAEVIEQVYPDEYASARSDSKTLARLLRKVRTLVSDIRNKKLAKANMNPDIIPPLSVDASKDTGIALRLAHLHRMDDKELDAADAPIL